MTRIALLPSLYPPSLGGVEELTRHLALSLVDAGDQVEVWTSQPDDAAPETAEIRDGLVVRRLPMPLPATNWPAVRRTAVTGTRTLRSLRSAVAAFRPEVLHVQCFGPNGAYATALSRLSGLPLVITLHGETLMDDADIFETSRVLRTALRFGMRGASVVTACSTFALADAEQRFGLAPGRGTVIPNGVALDDEWGLGAGTAPAGLPVRPYILALGRVVEKKGFDLLLEAFAAMDPGRRSADLVIAGAGPALESLRERAAALGVAGQVHFPGRLSRDEVTGAMAGATLFVMPSRLEPFGIVVLEAWKAGTAVVATVRGGPPEFVHGGRDGVLVDPFDTAAFAAALELLLDDPARRRAIALAGHQRVREFGWPTIAERYRQLYAGATGSKDGGSEPPGGVQRSHQGESVS
ncbi:MAG: glycosyltransferase family 4 protein [Acidimicrobiales bacterium]